MVDEDDKPHVSPVWVDVTDDGLVRSNTAEGRVKGRLLQPGTIVERTTDGADDHIDALSLKYIGAESYPFRKDGDVRVTIVIDPQEVVG